MTVQFNPSQAVDMAGMDEIVGNERARASRQSVTVGSVTFPANPLGFNYVAGAPTAPISLTSGSAFTLDAGQVLSGIITLKPTASVNVNLPTAAALVAGLNATSAGCQVGDIIQVLVINGASATFTLAPQVAAGLTFDANQATTTIAAATSRMFMFRVTNATIGSEAVVAYW